MPQDPLSDEQREIRDLVRGLARERIAPRAAEIDKSAEFPWDVVELYRDNDIFGILFDEEYGGIGASALMTLVAIEEVSKGCATSGLIIAAQELGSVGIKVAGTGDQKRRFLPRLASGEWPAAYALTGPGSGSDSAAMRTTAVRDGDEFVLNGGKRFITNAGVAHVYVVFAKTDPSKGHDGISAFVVEADAHGFEVGRIEPKMGIKGSTTGEIFFNDCRIPATNLLGEEGEGFKVAMRILDRSRPGSGARTALQVRAADRRGRRRNRAHEDLRNGEALLHGRGNGRDDRRGADPRRLRLHLRVSGRADDARREDHADLRRHEPDPAARDRAGDGEGESRP